MADQQGWQDRADELHDAGGVPPRRAAVVALRERGLSYREIADELDIANPGDVHEHVAAYLAAREDAQWLLEAGPAESDL